MINKPGKIKMTIFAVNFQKVCGMVCKLRHYGPLSTLKLVYYSFQYSVFPIKLG